MEEKKKGKGSLITIILLVVVIIGLVGYICYDKTDLFKDEKKKAEDKNVVDDKKEEKQPVVTNYAITDEKVAKLISNLMLSSGTTYCMNVETYANDKKVKASDIEANRAYSIVAYTEFYKLDKKEVTLDEFTKAIQKYLGKDYKYYPENVNYGGCSPYVYDSTRKVYIWQQTACGGTCGPTTSFKLVRAIDTDGILELDIKVIFASLDQGKDGYYSDYAKTNKIGTFEDVRDSLYEKGSDYKFTFKLEDGNYVFVSSYPVN